MDDFFRRLPKITNNHIHIFALIPYRKLLKIIMKIDPELYDKIYVLGTDVHSLDTDSEILYKYSPMLINDKLDGMPYKEITKREDWIKLPLLYPSFKNDLIITKHTENPFKKFEKIQTMFRVFIRNYKVYYYLWYSSLYVNYNNNVFYLNVRGKPGTISKDVKFSQRFFLNSKHIMPQFEFYDKISLLSKNDKNIRQSDYKYMFRQYARIKYESDLILKAVNDFNINQKYPYFVDDTHLLDDDIKINFKEKYNQQNPQMMVQYIITFPKKPKDVEVDFRLYMISIKMILFIAVIINEEYKFNFFNGVDLVGNEQDSHELSEYAPIVDSLLYFRHYGINFIPHIGETNIIKEDMSTMENYVFNKNITRIGHGMSFVTTKEVLNFINQSDKIISIESCPISNYLLGYYHPEEHPHQLALQNPKIKLVICSDDNGLFNYSSVTRDYIFIYKYWKINLKEIKKLITNGIDLIIYKYRQYYYDVFNHLWTNEKIDNQPDRPIF